MRWAFMASRFLSCFFLMNNLLCSHVCTNQPRESQISRPAIARGFTDMPHELVNPRVGSSSTCDPEVAVPGTAAKDPGECQGSRPIYSDARKRAFRRARRRAERCRGTMYRGRWHTARELGAGGNDGQAGDTGARPSGRRPIRRDLPWTAQPRLRVRSYNVGGITSDVYAVLHRWLTQESQDDIVILQVCTGDVGNRTAAGRYQAGL